MPEPLKNPRILGVPLEQVEKVYVDGVDFTLRSSALDRDPYLLPVPERGGGWDSVLVLDFGWWSRRIRVSDINVIETKEPGGCLR